VSRTDTYAGTRAGSVAGSVQAKTAGRTGRARWRCGGTWRRDDGSASVEFMVAVPLLLLMVMFIVQGAVWSHATHVAQAIATRALDAARIQGGSAAAGQAAAAQAIQALGSGVLRDLQIRITRTATRATVEVNATATSVVPGVHWAIHTQVSAPVERFIPATGSG
jgi:Flp pilus assembly protein TadG